MKTQFDAIVAAPFGAVGLIGRDEFVLNITLLPEAAEQSSADPFIQNVASQIHAYLNDAHFSMHFAYLPQGTPFQKRVWAAIAQIPVGQTLSYGELAARVGSGPRAVANACGANPLTLLVPCHRVLAKNGLGGFMQSHGETGLMIKRWLLQHEGVASG